MEPGALESPDFRNCRIDVQKDKSFMVQSKLGLMRVDLMLHQHKAQIVGAAAVLWLANNCVGDGRVYIDSCCLQDFCWSRPDWQKCKKTLFSTMPTMQIFSVNLHVFRKKEQPFPTEEEGLSCPYISSFSLPHTENQA